MRTPFTPWWRRVNAILAADGREPVLLRQAVAWWIAGLSPAQAVERRHQRR